MGAPEATAPTDASTQPTRWSPGDVSKNQLSELPQCVGNPRGGFVQSGERLGCIHEGNTRAAPKSFRKNGGRRFPQSVGNPTGLSQSSSSSEKPIRLARARCLGLENRCETAQLARDTGQPSRAPGRLGRSIAVAGVFRHVLETDLLSRAQIRSHGY